MSKYKYNLKKDKDDDRDYKFSQFIKTQELPSEVDYTPLLPSIYNQGEIGSCQSHAICAIVSYIHHNDFDPARLFAYYNVRKLEGTINEDAGGTLRGTCKSVAQYGVCDTKYWPYDVNKIFDEPPKEAYANATSDEIYSYYRIDSINELKSSLANGHLPLIGVTVTESFESERCMKTGIIPAPDGEVLGGHALVIVGYHDDVENTFSFKKVIKKFKSIFSNNNMKSGYFIIRNSWGTEVGQNGYFKISYVNLMKILQDAWVIIK